MKTLLLGFCILWMCLFNAFAETNVRELHPGMSRKEVIKILGPAFSVTNKDGYEVMTFEVESPSPFPAPPERLELVKPIEPPRIGSLKDNFIMPWTPTPNDLVNERRPSPRSSVLKNQVVFDKDKLVAFWADARLVARENVEQVQDETKLEVLSLKNEASGNGIQIVSIEPTFAEARKLTRFKIKFRYSLAGTEDGKLTIAANHEAPHLTRPIISQSAKPGIGEAEAVVDLAVPNWEPDFDFQIEARLSYPVKDKYPALTSNREISIKAVPPATLQPTDLHTGMNQTEVLELLGAPDEIRREGLRHFLMYASISMEGVLRSCVVQLSDRTVVGYSVGVVSKEDLDRARKLPDHKPQASVRIVSVEPAVAIPGQPTEFKFKVRYKMSEAGPAKISLSVNTKAAHKSVRQAEVAVTEKSGEVELTAQITPSDWGAFTDFRASVSLRSDDPQQHTPLATTNRNIPLAK